MAQERKVQNKPYIDLRPLHFGIIVGVNMQDVEMKNVGPQTVTLDDGTEEQQTILCDADSWDPGFSVGVLAEMRINKHMAFRVTPTMHFGTKRLMFRNLSLLNAEGLPTETRQNMKNTYISLPLNIKIAAERFNNYRPYVMFGLSEMLNLNSKNQDMIQLKRADTFIEVGMGCDFYLPFFKLVPELKFCYSLTNSLDTDHANQLIDGTLRRYANAVSDARAKMFVLTFYFE